MNRLFPALLCLVFVCLQGSPRATAGEGSPPLKVVVETGTKKEGPTVKLTVVNESKTYQLIEVMSCSWEDSWQTDDKHAQLARADACFKNVLSRIILAPGEKYAQEAHPLRLQGTPGKHKLRFGYVRRVSTFTNTELKRIYHSRDKDFQLYGPSFDSHFKAGSGKETFWSAPVTAEVSGASALRF